MLATPTIHRKALHDELVTRIRNMIIEGELRPGLRISEQDLCTRFGVSRTPLREALKFLSAEGLVRILPNRGSTVVSVTREEADDLLPVLGTLEALAGELACARIDQAGVEAILAMHARMIEHYRRGEEQPYIELDRAIHAAIFQAAGNQILSEAYHALQMRFCSLQSITRKAPPRWAEAVKDHERLMDALRARDGSQFAAIARRHIQHRADLVHEALDILDAMTAVPGDNARS